MAYIDKELFEQDIKMRYCNNCARPSEIKCRACHIDDMLGEIEDAPTADVAEVVHGEWKQGVPYVCSICGKPAPDEKNTSERYSCWASPYCPHCGAKMDGGNAE